MSATLSAGSAFVTGTPTLRVGLQRLHDVGPGVLFDPPSWGKIAAPQTPAAPTSSPLASRIDSRARVSRR